MADTATFCCGTEPGLQGQCFLFLVVFRRAIPQYYIYDNEKKDRELEAFYSVGYMDDIATGCFSVPLFFC